MAGALLAAGESGGVASLRSEAALRRRNWRELLECGDGVCGVAAFGWERDGRRRAGSLSLDTAKEQSGDFADSVTAVQDAGALGGHWWRGVSRFGRRVKSGRSRFADKCSGFTVFWPPPCPQLRSPPRRARATDGAYRRNSCCRSRCRPARKLFAKRASRAQGEQSTPANSRHPTAWTASKPWLPVAKRWPSGENSTEASKCRKLVADPSLPGQRVLQRRRPGDVHPGGVRHPRQPHDPDLLHPASEFCSRPTVRLLLRSPRSLAALGFAATAISLALTFVPPPGANALTYEVNLIAQAEVMLGVGSTLLGGLWRGWSCSHSKESSMTLR